MLTYVGTVRNLHFLILYMRQKNGKTQNPKKILQAKHDEDKINSAVFPWLHKRKASFDEQCNLVHKINDNTLYIITIQNQQEGRREDKGYLIIELKCLN
jgi:hypothetical protein